MQNTLRLVACSDLRRRILVSLRAGKKPLSGLREELKKNLEIADQDLLKRALSDKRFKQLTDIKEDSINLPERAGFIGRNKKLIAYAIVISYVAALFLSFIQDRLAIFVILFPMLIGVVYSTQTMSTFYFFFIRVFIGSIAFDIRDIEGDRESGVRTIPVVFGRERTKNLLLVLNSTLIPWLLISYLSGFFHRYLFVFIFSILYGYCYIQHFCKEGLKIGRSLDLLVDGEWIPVVIFARLCPYVI